MSQYPYCSCEQCGWFGKVAQLQEHETRPTALDLGFCPDCRTEIRFVMTRDEAEKYLRVECGLSDDEVATELKSLE